MGGGYMGKILRVNLTNKLAKAEPLDPKMAHDFIGGRGFVQKILYDEVPVGADPLGPDNKVVMARAIVGRIHAGQRQDSVRCPVACYRHHGRCQHGRPLFSRGQVCRV